MDKLLAEQSLSHGRAAQIAGANKKNSAHERISVVGAIHSSATIRACQPLRVRLPKATPYAMLPDSKRTGSYFPVLFESVSLLQFWL